MPPPWPFQNINLIVCSLFAPSGRAANEEVFRYFAIVVMKIEIMLKDLISPALDSFWM